MTQPHITTLAATPQRVELIGLMGRAGAGKSTAADYLQDRHDFEGYALATPIKDMLEALLRTVNAYAGYLHTPELKQQPIPQLGGRCARQLMTSLGDWGRTLDADWWINAAQIELGLPHAAMHHRLVITDVRYPNEAAWVRAMGGHIWLIERDTVHPVAQHASETAHLAVTPDHRLDNRGDLADLYLQLDAAVNRLDLAQQLRPTTATTHRDTMPC